MSRFGQSQARGRRSVPRRQSSLVVILTSPAGDHPVGLVDISRTGARMQGEILPSVGDPLTFQAEQFRTFGELVWRKGNTCAMEFDIPIAAGEVEQLRSLNAAPNVHQA